MGLLDITSSVLTLYKADTTDQKAKLKELQGEEKKLAEASLAAAEARNKATDSTIDKLGKLGIAFNVVSQIAGAAFEGLKDYGHRLDLEATAGAISIDKLSKAAGGLKSEMELLEHAAVFNKSAFQLTEQQMGTVEKAMWALEERGKKSEEVWGAVSTALTKGTTRALEGLIGPIQKSSDAFDLNGDVLQTYGGRAKAVDAILKQMAKTSAEVGEGQYDEADRVQVISVRITDAMEHIKEALGKTVVALEPLITAVATLTEHAGNLLNKIVEGWSDIADVMRIDSNMAESDDPALKRIASRHHLDISEAAKGRYENYVAQGGSQADWITSNMMQDMASQQDGGSVSSQAYNAMKGVFSRGAELGETMMAMGVERFDKMRKRYEDERRQYIEDMKRFAEEDAKLYDEETDRIVQRFLDARMRDEAQRTSAATSAELARSSAQVGAHPEMQGLLDEFNKTKLPGIIDASYNESEGRRRASFLEATFGKLEEFNLYKGAFDSLSGAIVSGFEAWITGSESFAQAFRKTLAKTMLGQSLEMAAMAIKATAMGIFAGVTGGWPAAAPYFASAAEFGAAALAFGAGAAVLGAGGGGGGGGASPSAPYVGGGGAVGGQTQSVIVIGDSFAEDTPRMRRLRAERLVSAARGHNAIVYE